MPLYILIKPFDLSHLRRLGAVGKQQTVAAEIADRLAEKAGAIPYAIRMARYFIGTFTAMGLYPIIFRRFNRFFEKTEKKNG